MRRLRSLRLWRRGLAALEVVIATAIAVPVAAGLYFLARAAFRNLLFLVGNGVGAPFL